MVYHKNQTPRTRADVSDLEGSYSVEIAGCSMCNRLLSTLRPFGESTLQELRVKCFFYLRGRQREKNWEAEKKERGDKKEEKEEKKGENVRIISV